MDLSDLRSDTRFLTSTTSSEYSDTAVDRNINRYYHMASIWILRSVATWQFDDVEKTNLPIATATLVDDQQDYELPAACLKLRRLEVKDDNGDWWKVRPLDQREVNVALGEFKETNGLPEYYDLMGDSIFFYPSVDADSVTTTNGLKLYFSREITELSATDDEVGFAEPFHRILSIGAGIDWCIAYGDSEKKQRLEEMLYGKPSDPAVGGLKDDLMEFYSTRHEDTDVRINPSRENYV